MAVGTQEVATRYSEADWTDFAHTGPGTLAGRYMRMFWQPVCRSVDLPSGRAKPIRIMSEDFTLYRGEEDPHPSPLPEGEGTAPLSTQHSALSTAASTAAAHVLAFRCAHRGTQLSTGWVEGEDLRCFYHGWKYDASGQCIEQPAEPEPFCQKIHIRSYPTEEYLGLIFAYFGEGDPPPMVRYPDLEEGFDRGRYEIIIYPNAPCNYFNRIENAVDESHLRFVHITTGYPGCPQIDAKETSYGIATRSVWSNGWINGAHYHMPNACQFKASSREKIAWRVPIDDEHYISYNLEMVRKSLLMDGLATAPELGAKILAGQMHVRDLVDVPNLFETQDFIAQVGQGVIADRVHDHLGQSDAGVSLLRKIWERELRSLAEGLPLTQWKRPPRMIYPDDPAWEDLH